jgi:hypothetical protein
VKTHIEAEKLHILLLIVSLREDTHRGGSVAYKAVAARSTLQLLLMLHSALASLRASCSVRLASLAALYTSHFIFLIKIFFSIIF